MTDCKFQPGTYWRTRDGRKAFIAAVLLPNPFGDSDDDEMMAYVEDKDVGFGSVPYRVDGMYWGDGNINSFDLISHWTDEPEIPEGWRVLEDDEQVRDGDRYYHSDRAGFTNCSVIGKQKYWCQPYIRRIEPETPEIPDGWRVLEDDEPKRFGDQYWNKDNDAFLLVTFEGRQEDADKPHIRRIVPDNYAVIDGKRHRLVPE